MKVIERISKDQYLVETNINFRFVKVSSHGSEIEEILEKFTTIFNKKIINRHFGNFWSCENYNNKKHLYNFLENELGIKYVNISRDFKSNFLQVTEEGIFKYHNNVLAILNDDDYYKIIQYKRNLAINKILKEN